MPLFSVDDSSNPITAVPHAADFRRWKAALKHTELQAIYAEFDRRIQTKMASGEDIVTAGWLPSEFPNGSHDWTGTAFEVIYEACNQSWQQTAWCFGLLLWEHMMNRPEAWHFMDCELDGVPIQSKTYFRCRTGHP